MNDRQIMRIAEAVRQAADEMVAADDCGMAMSEDLDGACGDVSLVLHSLLGDKVCFLTGGAFEGDGHAWVVLTKDLSILDLTATQFDVPDKVYRAKVDQRYQVDPNITFRDIRDSWGDVEWRGRLRRRAKKLLEG